MKRLVIFLVLSLSGAVFVFHVGCSLHSGATAPTVPTVVVPTPTVQSTATCSVSTVAGNTVAGTLHLDYSGNIVTTSVNLGTGVIQAISVYLAGASGMVRAGLYNDGGFGGAYNLVCESAPQTAVNGWNTLLLPAAPVTTGTYWIAVQTQNTTKTAYAFTGASYYVAASWGAFVDPFPQGPFSNVIEVTNITLSAYVNYCGP
jgi:hypothetical protein